MNTSDDHPVKRNSFPDVQAAGKPTSSDASDSRETSTATPPAIRSGIQLPELVSAVEMVKGMKSINVNFMRSVLPLGEILRSREVFGQQLAFFASSGILSAAEQFRNNLSTSYQESILGSLAAFSHATFGNSMITADFAAFWANLRVANLFDGIDIKQLAEMPAGQVVQIESIRNVARLVQTYDAFLTGLAPLLEVSRPAVLATRAWQDIVRLTPYAGSPYLERLDTAGHMTSWTIHAGIVLTEKDEEELERHEAEATAVLGPSLASRELRLRLTEIDQRLCDKLDGAWDRIAAGGPDATSQAANSLMELVDWTLRTLAPDELVLAWHTSEKRSVKELYEGRPTRSLRVRYAVRQHPEKNSALNLYLKAVQELTKMIQGTKHDLGRNAHKAVAPIAMMTEGLLLFLLID